MRILLFLQLLVNAFTKLLCQHPLAPVEDEDPSWSPPSHVLVGGKLNPEFSLSFVSFPTRAN